MEKYKIEYNLVHHPEGVDGEVIKKKGAGACDSIVILSILNLHGGDCSIATISMNGETGKGDAGETFKAWAILANVLMDEKQLPDWQREICGEAHRDVRDQLFLHRRAENENQS